MPARAGVAGATATTTDASTDDPQALVVSYWFDAGDEGHAYDAVVRLTGRRLGVTGIPRRGDTFSQDESVAGVLPGTGRVSLTAWIYGITAGEWTVDARLISGGPAGRHETRPRAGSPPQLQRASWSWRRWGLRPAAEDPIATRWALLAPLARQPAVIPGSYTTLAIVGFVLALLLQVAILTRQGLPAGPPFAASLITILGGLIGAKLWYKVLHPDEPLIRGGGWAVDGFLVVFPVVAAITLFAWDLPIGRVFDASTPGIFVAVAIGRVGCFLTGCCAGRCTASRWGIWSSDRRVGARRIPTQLLESAAGLLLAGSSLAAVLAGGLAVPGAVFVISFVIYAVVRQALLRLRAEQRKSARTLPLTAAAAGLVILVVAALALAQGA